MPHICLLSAYDTPSHQYWRKSFASMFPDIQWTQLTLPPRYFAWRQRGSGLSFAFEFKEELSQPFDGLIATSMLDLNSLLGFCPYLAKVPSLLYFHENQFEYPESEHQQDRVSLQITQVYSALSAKIIAFNSEFNRSTFLKGSKSLIKKLPDFCPKTLNDQLSTSSHILPVPLKCSIKKNLTIKPLSPLHILWNHRWEYDKNPKLLLEGLRAFKRKKIPFKLSIVGQQFRNCPQEFHLINAEFEKEIQHWGYLEKSDYTQLLKQANIVLSTALHDFQGLSIQEAISSGCIPICPNNLVYPEYIPQDLMYDVNDRNSELTVNNTAKGLASILERIYQQGYAFQDNPMTHYHQNQQFENYRSIIKQLLDSSH